MKPDLTVRLQTFSKNVIRLIKAESISYEFRSITTQLIRSSSSVGANYFEAQHAISRADFRNKVHISAKEAKETQYWLNLLDEVGVKSESELLKLKNEVVEIIKILTAISIKLKS